MNKMRCFWVGGLGVIMGLLLIVAPGVRAAPSTGGTSAVTPSVEPSPERKLEAFRKSLTVETDRRIEALKSMQQRVRQASALSTAHKSTLSVQIDEEVKTLEALKLELSAATSLEVLRELATHLSAEFKTYAFFVPKADLLRLIDRQLVVIEKLDAFATKTQVRIDAARKGGQDSSAAEQQLVALRQYIGNARQHTQTVELQVAVLAPTDFASDRKTLAGFHSELKIAHSETMSAVRTAREAAQRLAKSNSR